MAMQNCKDVMKKIAENLAKGAVCSAPDEFMLPAEKGDAIKVNELLEKAVITYTGQKNTIYGLRLYCEKFDVPVTEQAPDEIFLLLLINANADKIEQQLNAAGVKE